MRISDWSSDVCSSDLFVYTPLKKKGPIAVYVGAIPGAMPPLLGWVAATGEYGLLPGLLFAVQFVWQFPHFWAIAWVAHDDYSRAGYQLLPLNAGRTRRSEEHTSELQSLLRFLYAVFCLTQNINLIYSSTPLHHLYT